jgi:hypothetical protein
MRIIKENDAAIREWDKVAAVRLLEHLAVKDELRWAVGNNAPCQRDDVMEALRGTGKIMGGRNDGLPPRRLGIQDVHDLLLRDRVNPSHRLIQEVDLSACGDRARNKDPSSLPTGELSNLTIGEVGHVDALERLRDSGTICGTNTTKRADARRPPHCHHFINGDWKAPVNLFRLWDIGNTRRMDPNSGTEHLNRSGPRLHEPSDALQKRGLSTTIRSEDRGQ